MRKLIALASAGFILLTSAAAITLYYSHADFDGDENETDGPPGSDDSWILRNTYPTGHFDPQWVLDAGQQERQMAVAQPAGARTYSPSRAQAIGSPLALDPGNFIPLGPMPENNTQMNFGHVSGRVNVLRVDPTTTTSPNITVYSGTDGGGIWKTTNCCDANTTWTVTTDVPEVSSMSISDLVIDPANHNVIYAGTGDLNYGSFSFGASGVLKSMDGGQSWDLKGASEFTPFYPGSANSFPQYQAVGKVAVDPNHPNVVMAGTKTSLYISYDAGDNWSGPCFTNPFATGADPQRQDVTGLIPVSNGDGSTRLYVAIGTRGAATPVQPDLAKRGSNGVYRLAKIPATGCPSVTDWTLLANGWPAGIGNGVGDPPLGQTTPPAPTQIGRIEIAVSPSNPLRMYAQTEHAANKNIEGIYRSDDAGDHWTQLSANGVNADATNMGCGDSVSSKGGAQMWYDAGLLVDPTNPDRVFMSTTDLNLSSDGGANFRDVTCGWTNIAPPAGFNKVHVDHHARAFVGNDPSQMLIGSDGGVYYSSNANIDNPAAPSGSSQVAWTQLNDSINSIEFYFGDISGNFAASSTPATGAGAQDNGCSAAHFGSAPTGATIWNATCGGDGTTTKIEPVNNLIYFNSSQNGALARSLTYGSTFTGGFSTISANTRDPGVTTGSSTWGGDPVGSIFAMSYDLYKWGDTSVPGSGCSTSNGCNHMIAGTTRLWESVDIMNPTTATARSSWKARTADLTKDALNTAAGDIRSYINYVAYSFTNPGVAAVATNDGNVQIVFGLGSAVTANCPIHGPATADCATAVNVTDNNAILPNRPIFGVRFDPTTELVAYAAVGGFNANTPSTPGHVFQVTCAANCATFTWKDKTGNLPDIPAEQVMPNPNQPQQVFVGTDWGLYYTDDITQDSPQWFRFESFPHVMVWELVVDRGASATPKNSTTLAVFTRSRGAWVWPLTNAPVGTPQADLGISNIGPSTAIAGGTATYTLTVTNAGPASAQNVRISDPTPAGLTFVSASGAGCNNVPCTIPTLGHGESAVVTVTYAISSGYDTSTQIANVATVASDSTDPVLSNNSSTMTTTVTGSADVSVTQSGPAIVQAGNTVSYVVTVTNNGPSAAPAVELDDATPSGLTNPQVSGDCAALPCTKDLAVGASFSVTVTFTVPADFAGNQVTNTASATSATASDPKLSNNVSNFTTTVGVGADLALSVTATSTVPLGGRIMYTFTLTNNGPSVANDVSLDTTLAAGLVFAGNSGDCTGAFPCTFGTLQPGDVKTVNTTACVPSNYSGNLLIKTAGTASTSSSDPNTENNTASAYTSLAYDVLFGDGFETCP